MTTNQSRNRPVSTMNDTYLQPNVRPRANSSVGTSSPHSFQSNMAMVDGPAPAGNYYGVFLGEPPRGFPSSQLSSPAAGTRSLGSSYGSHHGGSQQPSDTRSKHSKHSSIAFPIGAPAQQEIMTTHPRSRNVSTTAPPKTPTHESNYQTSYYTIKTDLPGQHVSSTKIAHPQPVAMPPSALKRERRSTLCPSASTASDCLPASELRSHCKFTIGMVSECFKKPSNSPMFSRLKKTDALLSRVFTMLLALSSSPDALTTVDSCGLTQIFHQLQQLLHRALSSRPHNSDREQALEDCYYKLRDYADRLDLTITIGELESKISRLTFEHNVSQQSTIDIAKAIQRVQNDPHSSRTERVSAREQQAELDIMHRERVSVRAQISKMKNELAEAKKERDAILGTKTVRFQQVA